MRDAARRPATIAGRPPNHLVCTCGLPDTQRETVLKINKNLKTDRAALRSPPTYYDVIDYPL